jgi:hypothetical protein
MSRGHVRINANSEGTRNLGKSLQTACGTIAKAAAGTAFRIIEGLTTTSAESELDGWSRGLGQCLLRSAGNRVLLLLCGWDQMCIGLHGFRLVSIRANIACK